MDELAPDTALVCLLIFGLCARAWLVLPADIWQAFGSLPMASP